MRKSALVFTAAILAAGLAPAAAQAQGFGLGSLYGCQAEGQRNTTGAVVGGLLGGLAGSQISKNERTLGAVAGAAIGAAIGNSIGCRMDRQAAVRAQSAFQRALDTGRTQTWADEASGASGRIEVVDGPRPYAAARPDRSDSYEAIGRANIRSAPNVNAAVVDRLQVGEQVRTRRAVNGWLPVV
jgi:surface antigen